MAAPPQIQIQGDEPEEIKDPWCEPENPRRIPFELVTSAAYRIRDGVVKTPCDVNLP